MSLSVLSAPQPSAALLASAAAVQDDNAAPKSISPLIIVLGLLVFAGLIAALISGGGNGHGDFTPISPQ